MKSTFNNWYDKKMRATEELSAETDRAEKTLANISTIAIVGLSRSFHKDSQFVARYLQNAGYNIVPVNPNADTILGKESYPDLKSIPHPIDAVDVFLPSDHIHKAVDQAVELEPKPRAIWLQLGTGEQPKEIEKVKGTGIEIYENRCIKVDHQFLIRPKKESTNNN
ncbi:CoA-binding protein [Aliifodinibius salipaludis]|uniref:CoA-binding protein n=1 Tax=Fodinibius salipaludis TaxID=2032627 RepID=A0A2A2GCA0_9BACT|nr:CoA-binding protein [Aliifodinibius salipaludis]PAU94489.1 CoA-binding protein [Aliifodinibius salipaludis]